jgi:hypothetical protein
MDMPPLYSFPQFDLVNTTIVSQPIKAKRFFIQEKYNPARALSPSGKPWYNQAEQMMIRRRTLP